MNIINVQPKDVHVTLEVSIEEIARILDYYDLANPLYTKVMKDVDIKTGEYMENEFISKLRLIFDDVRKGLTNGS
jgi:hypothetical protein